MNVSSWMAAALGGLKLFSRVDRADCKDKWFKAFLSARADISSRTTPWRWTPWVTWRGTSWSSLTTTSQTRSGLVSRWRSWSVFTVNHNLFCPSPGSPPGAPGCRTGKRVWVVCGAARTAAPGEPPAGAPGQRLGGAAEGAGAVRRRADAAGEPSAEGRHGQDGEGERPGGGEPAGQVSSGRSGSPLNGFNAFWFEFTKKSQLLWSSKQENVSVLSCKRNGGWNHLLATIYVLYNEGTILPPCGVRTPQPVCKVFAKNNERTSDANCRFVH